MHVDATRDRILTPYMYDTRVVISRQNGCPDSSCFRHFLVTPLDVHIFSKTHYGYYYLIKFSSSDTEISRC